LKLFDSINDDKIIQKNIQILCRRLFFHAQMGKASMAGYTG